VERYSQSDPSAVHWTVPILLYFYGKQTGIPKVSDSGLADVLGGKGSSHQIFSTLVDWLRYVEFASSSWAPWFCSNSQRRRPRCHRDDAFRSDTLSLDPHFVPHLSSSHIVLHQPQLRSATTWASRKYRSDLGSTIMLKKLMVIAINRGVLTSLCAAINIILFFSISNTFLAFYWHFT